MKNKNVKRLCGALLTVTMLATALVGCGKESDEKKPVASQGSEASQATSSTSSVVESSSVVEEAGFEHDPNLSELGVEPICKEKVTLTIGLAKDATVEDYETNYYTKMLEDMANVDIEFHFFTASDMATQLDLLVNAGGDDLPDIIIATMDGETVYRYGEAGMFIPLNEYYENSSYYMAEKIEEVKAADGVDAKAQLTSYDGNIYAIPGYTGSYVNPVTSCTYLYTPWMEKLGLELPTTREDFYDILVAFKTQDPNGNGKQDEIPFFSAVGGNGDLPWRNIQYVVDSFVRVNRFTYFLDANAGQLSVCYTTDEFKEGIKFVKKLVDEGLFDATSFTTDSATFKTIMNAEGERQVGGFSRISTSFIGNKHPDKHNWTMLPPLTGDDGEIRASFNANTVDYAGYISKNCENPEVAFRLLDLMYKTEVMCTGRWGVQGENWDFVADLNQADYPDYNFSNTFAGYPATVLEYNSVYGSLQNCNWHMGYPALRTNAFTAGVSAAGMKEGTNTWEQSLTMGTYHDAAPAEKLSAASFLYADADEAASLKETANLLERYLNEKVGLWCTGVKDIDKEWDGFLKELEAMGLSDWLAGMQTAYDRARQ